MERIRLERWKNIPGYEGRYQISNLGRVRSLSREYTHTGRWGNALKKTVPGKILNGFLDKKGYLYVDIWKNNIRYRFGVHQLVLLAFVGPCPEGQEVRHFPNRDQTNNNLENLKYGTKQENKNDMIIHGTTLRGKKNPSNILDESQVLQIVEKLQLGIKRSILSDAYHVSIGTISDIKLGKCWSWLTGIETSSRE